MKNAIIVILILALLGIGGWAILKNSEQVAIPTPTPTPDEAQIKEAQQEEDKEDLDKASEDLNAVKPNTLSADSDTDVMFK